jgi:hypothetical protein
MIQIKKLSTKLLVILGVIVLCLIVWQSAVSKQVIGDMEKVREIQAVEREIVKYGSKFQRNKIEKMKTAEQIIELLNSQELKTYNRLPKIPFSRIKLIDTDAYILKGNEFAVYVSNYNRRKIGIEVENSELLIRSLSGEYSPNSELPVFIVMPEDPQLISFIDNSEPEGSIWSYRYRIHGFDGSNTLLSYEGGRSTTVYTDIPYINIRQKSNWLTVYSFNKNGQLNVDAEKSVFGLFDWLSDSSNVKMNLRESIIDGIWIHSDSKIGTLSFIGDTFLQHRPSNWWRRYDDMSINYSGECDSLIIQLTNNSERVERLILSRGLLGRYENIEVSDNIFIERR